jgi:hypothetical protein
MSATKTSPKPNNDVSKDDTPTADQGTVRDDDASSPLNKMPSVQYPSLPDNSPTPPSNDTAPTGTTRIPAPNQSTCSQNIQPMPSNPPNPSIVTDADLRTRKYLQSRLPHSPHQIHQFNTSHGHPPHCIQPQERGKNRGRPASQPRFYNSFQSLPRRYYWPTSRPRRHLEIALREMIVQVEDLVMDQLERCRYVEDVLDDLSDSDQSDDDYDNEEGGQDSEEGSAGGDDGHGKKRRNGNEDSDEAGTQKKHKSDRADEGGDGATAHTTGEAEGTGSTSSRTGAQRLEGMEMTESAIDDDIGNDTALGENLTEDESASRDHTATTTLQSSTCSTGDDGEVAVPELGTRKKSWCGLW